MFSLAQRRHIVTLVDRAMQEDGISLNRTVENLQVSVHSVSRLGLILGGALFYARVTFETLVVFNFKVP